MPAADESGFLAAGPAEPVTALVEDCGSPGSWLVSWPGVAAPAGAHQVDGQEGARAVADRHVLGRVPKPEYLDELMAAIDVAHGSPGWRDTACHLLGPWLERLNAALDGDVDYTPPGWQDSPQPLYLDLGHSRQMVGALQEELVAPELWADLDETAAALHETVHRLAELLERGDTLAEAAQCAGELVGLAAAVHLALADGYRAAHEAHPGRWSPPPG